MSKLHFDLEEVQINMKVLLWSATLAVALSQPLEVSENDLKEWNDFKVKHERNYQTAEEEEKRLSIFLDHLKFIRAHNDKYARGETSFTVAINKFADLSNKEIATWRGLKRPANWKSKGKEFVLPNNVKKVNATVDWRDLGAVTPVKNQGSCGSCWAFSTAGTIEGMYFLAGNSLVSLSEQNLVDCSTNGNNTGCDGGYQETAYQYVIDNKGIDTEKAYPYTGEDDSCQYKKKKVGATISSYVVIKAGSEKQLMQAVGAIGPVSVSIDASSDEFSFYDSGVFDYSGCKKDYDDLDHAVLAVGYGTSGKHKYWLVKNSWGTEWGIEGYIMMSRNKNNQCGIATDSSYPIV